MRCRVAVEQFPAFGPGYLRPSGENAKCCKNWLDLNHRLRLPFSSGGCSNHSMCFQLYLAGQLRHGALVQVTGLLKFLCEGVHLHLSAGGVLKP